MRGDIPHFIPKVCMTSCVVKAHRQFYNLSLSIRLTVVTNFVTICPFPAVYWPTPKLGRALCYQTTGHNIKRPKDR